MEIAERFNEYFINSIRDIRISIGNVHYENNVQTSNYKLNLRAISLIELENIGSNMRKKRKTTGEYQLVFYWTIGTQLAIF